MKKLATSVGKISENKNVTFQDHCHIISRFHGAAHNTCNLTYLINPWQWKLPIVVHNLRGYDGQVLIRAAEKRYGPIRVIPCNMERFTAFSIGRVQFLDIFQFTMLTIEKFAKILSDKDCMMTSEVYPDDEQFKLMILYN